MARGRNNNKLTKFKKIEPAVMTLSVVSPAQVGGSNETHYVDLSQITSLLNRRFYRQGLNWAVSGIKITTNGLGTLATHKLPATWTMSNSWHKGFAAWEKMNDEALEESESVRPRFLDFKVYADSRHHNLGFGANLLPFNYSIDPVTAVPTLNTAVPGEWESSKLEIPDNTLGATGGVRTREIVAVGPNFPGAGASGFDAVSLIEGYANSRGLPDILDPNVPADSGDVAGSGQNWISQLFSDGTLQTDEVIDTMISENNQAPYPFENAQVPGAAPGTVFTDTQYPGGTNQLTGLELHDVSFITGTTVGGHTSIKGGLFPCGLIGFQWAPTESSQLIIQIDLVPGNHRGYLAEPMQDM